MFLSNCNLHYMFILLNCCIILLIIMGINWCRQHSDAFTTRRFPNYWAKYSGMKVVNIYNISHMLKIQQGPAVEVPLVMWHGHGADSCVAAGVGEESFEVVDLPDRDHASVAACQHVLAVPTQEHRLAEGEEQTGLGKVIGWRLRSANEQWSGNTGS